MVRVSYLFADVALTASAHGTLRLDGVGRIVLDFLRDPIDIDFKGVAAFGAKGFHFFFDVFFIHSDFLSFLGSASNPSRTLKTPQ